MEARDELLMTEKAWDLAHVHFRAERGIQAIVHLECRTPTALSLFNWGMCQRSTPSGIQSKLTQCEVERRQDGLMS